MKQTAKSAGALFNLVPQADVSIENDHTHATSCEPWLRFESCEVFTRAKFIEICYRASFFDDPVRPVLRFRTENGDVDRILPGPVAGAGLWRGAVPPGTREVHISPCARAGRFAFCVEYVRQLPATEILRLVWRRRRSKLWSILLAASFGYVHEAENAMHWAIASESVATFPDWFSERQRSVDVQALDAPRFDWALGPSFLLIVDARDAGEESIAQTLASFKAQHYANYRVHLLGARTDHPPITFDVDFVALLRAGDELLPLALAAVAEEIHRSAGIQALYADELIAQDGVSHPEFKPNWSPDFESERSYIGRCLFVRANRLSALGPNIQIQPLVHDIIEAARACDTTEIRHLRRWLLRRNSPIETQDTFKKAAVDERSRTPRLVSIILLTKDRADLLGPCLASILRNDTGVPFELLIVDNGTRQKQALALLEKASLDSRVRVLHRPEPFNFAKLNNDAVVEANGDVLVFLNNDTEVITPDWLEQLCCEALAPERGAVGALLLFPDGRIQHAGVVVGLGQDAGHFEALRTPDAPSWLDRTATLHEASAVTAACMAVERRKFDAVGGFDAQNLPIEFNDVDLCLRLGEKGWTNVYMPSVRLIHKESASRGTAVIRPMKVYAAERDYFRSRWRSVIRDDPFFHPALSLYARHIALG